MMLVNVLVIAYDQVSVLCVKKRKEKILTLWIHFHGWSH